MKKFFALALVAAAFVSCKNDENKTAADTTAVGMDTVSTMAPTTMDTATNMMSSDSASTMMSADSTKK